MIADLLKDTPQGCDAGGAPVWNRRDRVLACERWVTFLLGIVLIALGIRLWFAEMPGLA